MENVRITPVSPDISQLTFKVLRQDATLKLGHASAMLILERWNLARIPMATPATSTQKSAFTAAFAGFEMRLAAIGAMEVLSALRALTAAHGTTPIYDSLLGTYAGVTLVQFADLLTNVHEVAELMQKVDQERNSRLRSREPVLTWATNMMQKKALDLDTAGPGQSETSVEDLWSEPQDRVVWVPLGVLESAVTN
jgi:hypothetical protein